MKKGLAILVLIAVVFSCKKDPQSANPTTNPVDPYATSNDVTVNFTNVADNVILQISKDTIYDALTPKYVNANNDTFSISTFKYYISNIRLKKADGSYYVEPESYHLINLADTLNTAKFTLKNVPLDYYVSMDFVLGVDSTRNCSGAQTGALDPSNDMFWTWSSGYIFMKFEGYSKQSYFNAFGHNLTFHVGGYTTPYNNIRTITLPFNAPFLSVTKNKVPGLYLKTNVLDIFRNPNTIDFATQNSSTSPASVKKIVTNYQKMFSVSAIKN